MIKSETIKSGDLYKIAGGLNIEGGFPARDAGSSTPWVNLVLVLDRPLVDNVIFDDLIGDVRKKKYPLLENGVLELDEPKFLTAYLAIMAYYMQKHKHIVVHIHQFPEFSGLVNLIKEFAKDINAMYNLSCEVQVRTDHPFYEKQEYKTDMLLSFSQCAGLDPKLEAGALIIPTTFVPFDCKTVFPSKKYKAENVLVRDLADILKSEYHDFAVAQMKSYTSDNMDKKQKPRVLTLADFHTTKILQVAGIWNPTNCDELVGVL